MGSGENRIARLGDHGFRGQVGKQIAKYARDSQQLGRDLAVEFDTGAMEAEKSMRKLRGHPALLGVDVRIRAILVTRSLRRARDLSKGIAVESVKLVLQYRKEFLDIDDSGRAAAKKSTDKSGSYTGGVDL